MRIALLGAQSTGKSQLAEAIAHKLNQLNLPAVCLRECSMTDILQAEKNAITIADATPVILAIEQELLLADDSLNSQVMIWQKQFDITLLTGLDLTSMANGMCDHSSTQATVDQYLRQILHTANVNYQVIYGQGKQRLDNALFCMASAASKLNSDLAQRLHHALARAETQPKWTGPCETCGDGECEHRLFTRLVR